MLVYHSLYTNTGQKPILQYYLQETTLFMSITKLYLPVCILVIIPEKSVNDLFLNEHIIFYFNIQNLL